MSASAGFFPYKTPLYGMLFWSLPIPPSTPDSDGSKLFVLCVLSSTATRYISEPVCLWWAELNVFSAQFLNHNKKIHLDAQDYIVDN